MLRKKIYAGAIALVGAIALPATTQAAPRPWEMGFQPAATPVMERIEDFHHLVLVIITAICVFVLALLIWIMIRYNKRANPTPSKVSHNTLLEVAWTIDAGDHPGGHRDPVVPFAVFRSGNPQARS